MTAIDQQNAQKWDEIEAVLQNQLKIMLDTARRTGYYGHETLLLYAQNGKPHRVERISQTSVKA